MVPFKVRCRRDPHVCWNLGWFAGKIKLWVEGYRFSSNELKKADLMFQVDIPICHPRFRSKWPVPETMSSKVQEK